MLGILPDPSPPGSYRRYWLPEELRRTSGDVRKILQAGSEVTVHMKVLETERLILRWLTIDDADFIFALMNEPAYLRFIGDKGIKDVVAAREHILTGPVDSYERHGYGLYLTERKEDGVSIGICGLVNRESLDGVDIGFAFLAEFWSSGYARESAEAVVAYGKNVIGLERILAITAPDNESSIKLLGKIGFNFAGMISVFEDEPDVKLFTRDE